MSRSVTMHGNRSGRRPRLEDAAEQAIVGDTAYAHAAALIGEVGPA